MDESAGRRGFLKSATRAVNKYLQSWDVPNVFVDGESAFPQNGRA